MPFRKDVFLHDAKGNHGRCQEMISGMVGSMVLVRRKNPLRWGVSVEKYSTVEVIRLSLTRILQL